MSSMASVKEHTNSGRPAVGNHRHRDIYMRAEKHPTLLGETARSVKMAGAPPDRSTAGAPLRKFLERMAPPSWLG
jgi:hypothetical protein